MCPWTPVGRSKAGEQIGVALGGRRRLPAGPRPFREAGFPEALQRPGSSQATRPVARLASRLGAAGEPGTLHTGPRLSLADAPYRRGGLNPVLHLPAPRTHPPPTKSAAPRCSPPPHSTPLGLSEAWHTDSLHNPSLFVGGGAEPGAAALSQPTDPIKYYLCLKIPVIGYAAAFSEPCAKRSKNSQSGRSYFNHANSHFL